MKRCVAAVLFLLLFICSVFAADGVMSGERDLKVVKTQWFDIIYSPGSAQCAAVLAENADTIYINICRTLGTEPWFRMPVVITPAQDEFNAYFTSVPYNHIVLFDTPVVADMAVFSQNILSVFRHECTHAVTFNLKNKFWRVVGNIFGDAINTAGLFVTPGWAEGAAVSFESMNGEGRLNDEYSRQIVRQAKIENSFPAYADVQGASDMYPSGSYYYFNGAFDAWLQKTYGMDKYARFWHKCVNFQTITAGVAFRSTYGISLNNAWALFRDSVSVPDIPASPLTVPGYADAFAVIRGENGAVFSAENRSGSRYGSITSSAAGFACVDYSCDKVLFFAGNGNGTSYKKPRILFIRSDIDKISLSSDGSLMAVSVMSEANAVPKNCVYIYNMTSGTFYQLPDIGLRDATVVTDGERCYAVAVKTYSQNTALIVYELERPVNGKRIVGARQSAEYRNLFGTVPFSLADGGQGKLIYVMKQGLTWTITLCDLAGNTETQYQMPERMVVRHLSWSGMHDGKNGYQFSFTKQGTLPRLGKITIDAGGNAEKQLQQTDVSGGIYFPVASCTRGITIYSGVFYRNWRLFVVDTARIPFETVAIPAVISAVGSSAETIPQPLDAVPYNPFQYYQRGVLEPFPLMSTYMLMDNGLSSFPMLFGATYISSNPWNSRALVLSAGYNFLTNSGGLLAETSGGTATALFSYALQGQVEFDEYGYKQTVEIAQCGSAVPFGRYSYFKVNDKCNFLEGRQSDTGKYFTFVDKTVDGTADDDLMDSDLFGIMKCTSSDHQLYAANQLSAGMTSIHSTGSGTYEKCGAAGALQYTAGYYSAFSGLYDPNTIYQNIGGTGTVRLPKLLPVICRSGYTYNLPVKASVSLFADQQSFVTDSAQVVLFSYEIQKAIPILPVVFINRFTLTAEYSGSFAVDTQRSWSFLDTPVLTQKLFTGGLPYYDRAGLGIADALTPNFGMLASSSYSAELKAVIYYYIRPDSDQKYPVGCSLSYSMVY